MPVEETGVSTQCMAFRYNRSCRIYPYLPYCQSPDLFIPPKVGHNMYIEQVLDVCYADGNGRCYNCKDKELGYWRIGEAGGKHVAVGTVE